MFYFQDLFFISPFYHLVFPMNKFIITDADIEFMDHGLALLHSHFDLFKSDQLYAFAKDMSPLYRTMMFNYRQEHQETRIGDPGDLQGVNTGVVMLNLERMRNSQVFSRYLDSEHMTELCQEYKFKGFIGDQDWWNIVVWDKPQLVHFLDCAFNYQFKQEFNTPPFDKVTKLFKNFNIYFNCVSDICRVCQL